MNWHAWVVSAVFLGTAWAARASDPVTFAEISLRVRMGEPPQAILEDAARRKLLDALTNGQEETLRKEGVAAPWIEAFRAPALLAPPEAAAAFRARKEQLRETAAQAEKAAAQPAATPTPPKISGTKAHESDVVKVGDRAPDFTARAVGGKELSLACLKGRVTLLTIFATWCPSCLQELTAIEKVAWPKYQPEGLAMVALGSGDNVLALKEFKQKNAFTFDLAEDPKKAITAQYATNFIPRCYVVGKDGVVKFASIGVNKEDFLRMLQIIESELHR